MVYTNDTPFLQKIWRIMEIYAILIFLNSSQKSILKAYKGF